MPHAAAALVSKGQVLAGHLTRFDLPGSVNRHALFVEIAAPSIDVRQRRCGSQSGK
jgi:hypothetical protein